MSMVSRVAALSLCVVVHGAMMAPAAAQDAYPNKPVRLIAPFPPGVTTGQRSKALPDISTMGESGLKEQFPNQWWGIAAPKGTPRPIIDRVNAELAAIVKSHDVLERFDGFGVFPEHTTPEQMLDIVKAEGPPMSKLLQAAGIKPQ